MNFKIKLQDLYTTKPLAKLMAYMKPDKDYIIEIKVAKERRSLNQNEYYFGVVIPIFMEKTGYTKEESHQLLKARFLFYYKETEHFEVALFTRSTTELSTIEFEKYLEDCRLFTYHEFGVTIPLPNALSEEELMKLENLNRY